MKYKGFREFVFEEENEEPIEYYYLEKNKYKSITKCTIESRHGDYYKILSGRTTLKRWNGVICESFEDAEKLKEILGKYDWYNITPDDTTLDEIKEIMNKILDDRKAKKLELV